jgi:small subunit ribosomal protein S8
MIDNFSNLLTCIRNGLNSRKLYIDVPRSRRLIKFILFFIKKGYLSGVIFTTTNKNIEIFRIFLKYDGQKPVISGLFRISKPSRRIYINIETLKRMYSPNIMFVVSTNQGYLSGFEALKKHIGGELVCVIY